MNALPTYSSCSTQKDKFSKLHVCIWSPVAYSTRDVSSQNSRFPLVHVWRPLYSTNDVVNETQSAENRRTLAIIIPMRSSTCFHLNTLPRAASDLHPNTTCMRTAAFDFCIKINTYLGIGTQHLCTSCLPIRGIWCMRRCSFLHTLSKRSAGTLGTFNPKHRKKKAKLLPGGELVFGFGCISFGGAICL